MRNKQVYLLETRYPRPYYKMGSEYSELLMIHSLTHRLKLTTRIL